MTVKVLKKTATQQKQGPVIMTLILQEFIIYNALNKLKVSELKTVCYLHIYYSGLYNHAVRNY